MVRTSPAWLLLGAAACLLVGVVIACQVPVFRYALERWDADRYELLIEASGDLSPAEQEAVDFLVARATDREMPTNVIVRLPKEKSDAEGADGEADAGADAADTDAAAGQSAPATMSLHYPGRMRGILTKPIWSGQVNLENAKRVIDSPARRELMRRILQGESAIWVIVESGDAAKDDAAEAMLTESMGEAGETLKVPDGVIGRDAEPTEGYVDPENVLQSDVPLKIGFSLLRIQRSDPEEQVFLQMLLNIEDDLGEYAAEPMSFPVFGRGRFLEPLIGRGVTRDNIFEASMYLCGACSCEVKDQNPGMDLLMSMNWDMAMDGSQVIIDKILPPLEGTAALLQAAETAAQAETSTDQTPAGTVDADDSDASGTETATEASESGDDKPLASVQAETAESGGGLTWRKSMMILVAGIGVILAAGTIFILGRKQA